MEFDEEIGNISRRVLANCGISFDGTEDEVQDAE